MPASPFRRRPIAIGRTGVHERRWLAEATAALGQRGARFGGGRNQEEDARVDADHDCRASSPTK